MSKISFQLTLRVIQFCTLLHLEVCKSNANPIWGLGMFAEVSMGTARYNVMVETQLKLGQATVT